MSWVIILGLLAAAFTTAALLPQVIKTVKTKKTDDLSLLMYIILSIGISLWLIYGLLTIDLPIIIANSITLILTVTVLVLKIRHG